MGQEVSKNLRFQLEHSTLEELLVKDEVVKDLKRHPLPKTLRENLAGILTISSNVNAASKGTKHRGKLAPLYSLRSKDISSIPQDVQVSLRNLDSLRKFHECQLLSGDELLSPSSHYDYTRTIESARSQNRIV